jgi:hypothetical protein
VVTGNVPAEAGTVFFFARLPAIASMGMIMKNRPTSIVNPPAVLYQGVLPLMPPNAEPLFPADDVNSVEDLGQAVWTRIADARGAKSLDR